MNCNDVTSLNETLSNANSTRTPIRTNKKIFKKLIRSPLSENLKTNLLKRNFDEYSSSIINQNSNSMNFNRNDIFNKIGLSTRKASSEQVKGLFNIGKRSISFNSNS